MQILRLPFLAPAITILAFAPATSASRCRGSCGHQHVQHGHHRYLLSQRHHEHQQLLDAVFNHFFDKPNRPTTTAEKHDKQAGPAPSTTTPTDKPAANESSLTILSPAFRTYSGELAYELQLDMPGVSATALNLEVDSDGSESSNYRILTVIGQRSSSGSDEVQYAERFLMPQDVEEASITAHAADGLVTVTMPKKPAEPPTRIPVTNFRSGVIPDGEKTRTKEAPPSVPEPEPPATQVTQAETQPEAASNSEASLPEKEAGSDQQRVMGLLATPPAAADGPTTSSSSSEDAGIDDVVTLLTEIKNSLDLQGTDTASEANWKNLVSKLKSQVPAMQWDS